MKALPTCWKAPSQEKYSPTTVWVSSLLASSLHHTYDLWSIGQSGLHRKASASLGRPRFWKWSCCGWFCRERHWQRHSSSVCPMAWNSPVTSCSSGRLGKRYSDYHRDQPPLSGEVKSLSPVQLCDPMDYSLPGSSIHGIF